ncbi:MAG: RNA methyltransferase [Alphaproteobacteria bacterium]|nr:RNA methyltransferase [Alphaproteobacteria bacterium]
MRRPRPRPHAHRSQNARPGAAKETPASDRHARDLVRVAGLPAVAALFARGAERVERLFFTPELQAAAQPMAAALGRLRRPFRSVAGEELQKIAGTAMHGGIVAVARPRPLRALDPDEALRWAARERLVIALDGVSNPHNLGAIARTAAFFGVGHMILSDHPGQALPSDAAYRIAEGGLDHVELLRATRLPALLERLAAAFRVVGTSLSPRAVAIEDVPRDRPILLVLGNEEHGLSHATAQACGSLAIIRGGGAIQSLNVGAATAIAIHMLSRSR